MQATFGEKEITALLHKVQIFNRAIGGYEMFAINSSFDYVVKLSNGTIYFKVSELKEDENGTISPDSLLEIAYRFNATNSNTQQQHQSQHQQQYHDTNQNRTGTQNINNQSQSSVNFTMQKRGFSFGRFFLGLVGIVALVIIVLVIAAVVLVGRVPFL